MYCVFFETFDCWCCAFFKKDIELAFSRTAFNNLENWNPVSILPLFSLDAEVNELRETGLNFVCSEYKLFVSAGRRFPTFEDANIAFEKLLFKPAELHSFMKEVQVDPMEIKVLLLFYSVMSFAY